MRENFFLNQGAVNVEFRTQNRDYLGNIESIRAIRNHPSIHTTLIISIINVMVRNQICASDVDRRIISSRFFQNQTLRIRKLTGTPKILQLVRTDRGK